MVSFRALVPSHCPPAFVPHAVMHCGTSLTAFGQLPAQQASTHKPLRNCCAFTAHFVRCPAHTPQLILLFASASLLHTYCRQACSCKRMQAQQEAHSILILLVGCACLTKLAALRCVQRRQRLARSCTFYRLCGTENPRAANAPAVGGLCGCTVGKPTTVHPPSPKSLYQSCNQATVTKPT